VGQTDLRYKGSIRAQLKCVLDRRILISWLRIRRQIRRPPIQEESRWRTIIVEEGHGRIFVCGVDKWFGDGVGWRVESHGGD